MKPKDLKIPPSWDKRSPMIHDEVLFVPLYYVGEGASMMAKSAPLKIEYCSGNGDWVIDRAQRERDVQWISVERRFDRVRKIWSKMKNGSLQNLSIVSGEAYAFTRHFMPQSTVDEVFINFPDPWPKRRHEKNRLIAPPFIHELARILKREGKVTFVTDDNSYLEGALKHFLACSAFHLVGQGERADQGMSFFENLWRSQGRTIHFFHVEKSDV